MSQPVAVLQITWKQRKYGACVALKGMPDSHICFAPEIANGTSVGCPSTCEMRVLRLQVYRASGPKWRLIWGFTLLPEWEDYQKNYTGQSQG